MKRDCKTYIRKLIPYIPFLLYLGYALFLHRNAGMRDYDDYVYRDAWSDVSINQWVRDFYMGWSGRLPLQMMGIVFLQFPLWVWRIWNALLLGACPFLVARMVRLFCGEWKERGLFLLHAAICGLFVLIPGKAMDGAVLWISGSFNYLLPAVGLFLALYPFFSEMCGKERRKREYIIAAVGTFFCCYAEQTAAVFVCLAALLWLFTAVKRRTRSTPLFLLWVFGMGNMLIEYIAPGNYVRYDSEVILWYREYDMYSFADKLVLGFVHCMKMLLLEGWPLIACVFVLILAGTRRKSLFYKGMFLVYCAATGVMIFFLRRMYDNVVFLFTDPAGMIYLFSFVSWLILLAVFLLTVYDFDDTPAWIPALLVLAAFAAGTVVAMSPSYYGAELRVYFIPYLLLIFTVSLQLPCVCRREEGGTFL